MNDLSTHAWRLDTPSAFGNPGAVLWPSWELIRQIEFSTYAVQGNKAILKDRNGKIIWSATGAADLSPVRCGDIGWHQGMVLDTLDSGLVVVYIK